MTIARLGQLTAETQDLAEVVSFGADAPTISVTKVRTGTYSYRIDDDTNPFGYPIPVTEHVRAGFWFNHVGLALVTPGLTATVFIWFAEGSAVENSVRYDQSASSLILTIDGVEVDTASAAACGFNTLDTWIHCGLHVHNDAATGVVKFYVDGIEVLSFTGDTGSPEVGAFYVSGDPTDTRWGDNAYVDDFYIDSLTDDEMASPPPSKRFLFSLANAAGATADFTPSGAATNHEAVDDAGAPDGDATYNKALVANLKDTFNSANVVLPLDYVIRAVIPIAYAKKTDAGGTLGLRLHTFDGSTFDDSGIKTLSTAYAPIWERFPLQPDDTAWNETDFNAMMIGYESDE